MFEARRSAIREALGYPVTQPGAFAVMMRLVEARAEEVLALARSELARG